MCDCRKDDDMGHGAYNVKLIEYPNGTTVIRFYDGMIEFYNQENEPGASAERTADQTGDRDESLASSVARTRRMIEHYSRCARFEWFLTLTFSPEHTDRYDYALCIRKFQTWLKNFRRYSPELQAVFVPELHALEDAEGRRAVHFHGLVCGIGMDELIDTGHKKAGAKVYALKRWHWGFSHVTAIRSRSRISHYMRKYCQKGSYEIAEREFYRHRYFTTGLQKPTERLYMVSDGLQEEFIDMIAEKTGKAVSWRSETPPGAYLHVEYVELTPKEETDAFRHVKDA